jgi:putative ABC transport system substrate-binding protein
LQLRRREFIALLGNAAVAVPVPARAEPPAMPVIGVLNGRGANEAPELLAAFRQGLSELGFLEGQNVTLNTALPSIKTSGCPR